MRVLGHTLDLGQLETLTQLTNVWTVGAQGRSLVKSRHAFMDWAKLMWSKSPGAVHRRVRSPPPDPLPREILREGAYAADPS
eukprot:1551367-Pyramimonas_sp.AAC.1